MSGASSSKPPHALRSQNTLANLRDFATSLEGAVNQNLPTGPTTYGHVAVFGITWDNDDIGCPKAEKALFKVLRKQYNFDTTSYVAQAAATDCTAELQSKLISFRKKHEGPDTLLIIVYSGHSSPNQNDELELYGTPNGPVINWNDVRGIPRHAQGRVLLIFDSCYAGSAGTYNGPELIAASGLDNQASASSTHSFTALLTQHLEQLQGLPHSVGQIYSDMCRNSLQTGLAVTPVHFLQRDMESVVLERTPAASHAFGTGNKAQRDASLRQLGDSGYRVLVGVHLAGPAPAPELAQWKKWLAERLPSMIDKVTIEARYEGSSTHIHVAMPIEVWDGLPADESAYSFLGWITSGNTLLSGGISSDPQLPERPKNLKENNPFAGSSKRG